MTANRLEFKDVTVFPRPGQQIPGNFRFSGDGKTLYYLHAEEGKERVLWAYDLHNHTRRVAASAPTEEAEETFDEQMRRQRARLRWSGISGYTVKGNTLLVPHRGKLFVSQEGRPLSLVPHSEGVVDPSLTPDGQTVIGVVEGDLCLTDVDSGARRWLTRQAALGLSYGLAEYIAQEELDRSRGYWMSPEGQFVAFAEVDERHVPVYPIVHQEASGVWLEEHRYPFVGQADAHVRLAVRSVAGDEKQWSWTEWNGEDRYLLDLIWTKSDEMLVLSIARSHQHLAWERFDREGRFLQTVYEETSSYWINRPQASFVTDDGVLISTSERDGHGRVLVVSGSDQWHLLPEDGGDWEVLEVMAVDPASDNAYVLATRNRALERTLVRINWVSGEWTDLAPSPGWHQPVVAEAGRAWLDIFSSREKAPEVILHTPSGLTVMHESAVDQPSLGVALPEFFVVQADDGTELNGILYCPSTDAPAGGWPLVVSVYGGPHAQMVVDEWSETVDLTAQYLVQHGFAVMKLDNRGSAHRGAAFERALFRHFGEAELADQIAGVRYVAQRWPINLRRVGIYGWSYGGYMTLRALLMAPDIFRVGVSGAPVTDFRWYDTGYTERYLGTDVNNHEGYETSQLVDKAGRLQGKLLLIHGMVDENVHFRHSAAMIDALVEAGKDFDLVILPGSRHMVSSEQADLYRVRRQLQFFEDNL